MENKMDFNNCRLVAFLMDKTKYSIQDVVVYLNGENDYLSAEKHEEKDYVEYMIGQTKLPKTKITKLHSALKYVLSHSVSLLHEYNMMKNTLMAMQKWEGFIPANQDFYQSTVDYMNHLEEEIIKEYGLKIKEKQTRSEVIHQYMMDQGFSAEEQ